MITFACTHKFKNKPSIICDNKTKKLT